MYIYVLVRYAGYKIKYPYVKRYIINVLCVFRWSFLKMK